MNEVSNYQINSKTNEKIIIIGIIGKNRVGKDTFANLLIHEYDFIKYAFADPIKEVAKTLFGFTHQQLEGNEKEVIDPFWGISPRQFYQVFGTEMMQKDIYKYVSDMEEKVPQRTFWVRKMEHWIQRKIEEGHSRFVISDVRFIHEATALHKMGAKLIKIVRPEIPLNTDNQSTQQHISQQELDQILLEWIGNEIVNDGDISSYLDKIRRVTDVLI